MKRGKRDTWNLPVKKGEQAKLKDGIPRYESSGNRIVYVDG